MGPAEGGGGKEGGGERGKGGEKKRRERTAAADTLVRGGGNCLASPQEKCTTYLSNPFRMLIEQKKIIEQ